MHLFARKISTPKGSRTEKALTAFLKRALSPERYQHSLSVAGFSESLCLRLGLDPEKGFLAGLGHDVARELPDERILALAKDGVPFSRLETEKPVLLHGKAAAYLLRRRFGLADKEILDAIRYHTLGHPGLNDLGKVLFVADYLEPTRKFIDDRFRAKVLGLDLGGMVLAVIEHSAKREKRLAGITRDMYDALKRKRG